MKFKDRFDNILDSVAIWWLYNDIIKDMEEELDRLHDMASKISTKGHFLALQINLVNMEICIKRFKTRKRKFLYDPEALALLDQFCEHSVKFEVEYDLCQ